MQKIKSEVLEKGELEYRDSLLRLALLVNQDPNFYVKIFFMIVRNELPPPPSSKKVLIDNLMEKRSKWS